MGGILGGDDDRLIACATADVAGYRLDNLFSGGVRFPIQERLDDHNYPGRAVTALGGVVLVDSLLDRVQPEMSVYTDEIFGPVLSVVRVGSYDEALALVNANRYGNGTAIFTNDGGAARRYQNEVEVGMVGVNVPIPVPMAYYSFGGWKDSLFGDSHAHGAEGVHFFTRGKVVTSRWLDPSHGGINLGFPEND